MKNLLIKLDKFIFSAFSNIALLFLVGLFILMALNVLLRFFPLFSLGWFDEIVELLFSWMIFCEAAVLWRIKQHPYIDLIESKLKSEISKNRLGLAIELINISFLSIFVYFGSKLAFNAVSWSPIFKIPKTIFYLSMPLTGIYMILCSLYFIYEYRNNIKSEKSQKRINDIESQFKIRRS